MKTQMRFLAIVAALILASNTAFAALNFAMNQAVATVSDVVFNSVTLGGTNVAGALAGKMPNTYAAVTNALALTGSTGTFLRSDGTQVAPAGGGDALVANPLSQFAATTSAQLAGVLSNETGSGLAAFGTSPTFITPLIDDYLDFNEEAVPATPGAAKVRMYAKADGLLYGMDDAGVETALSNAAPSDTAFAASWNGVTTIAPSKNSIYDWGHIFDTDDDGKVNVVDTAAGVLIADSSGVVSAVPLVYEFALSDETTAITTGTAKVTWRAPFAMTVTAVRASLSTSSSSGLPTVDINEGGVTILSTKLTIDASEKTSTTAATPAVISDSAIADDAEVTFDIDVAGTGAAGLKVKIFYTR